MISQPTNVNYCGTAIEPEITVVDSGAVITPDDYTVSYTNNISPGLATVTITGQANYQGVVTRNFTIKSPAGGGTSLPQMNGIDVNPQSVSFDPPATWPLKSVAHRRVLWFITVLTAAIIA